MGVPYETVPEAGRVITGGTSETFQLKFPPRSFISKIIVVQQDGVNEGFLVELFNHRDAMAGNELSSSDSETHSPLPLDIYRVCTPLEVAAGQSRLLYFSDEATGGHGLLFYCQDPDRPDRRGQKQGNLYLRITPRGTGPKHFAFVVGGESQISGV